jgi:photosystem II stability/assembly factor-like uncharacterized protein
MKSLLLTVLALAAVFSTLNGQWEVINEGYEPGTIDFASDKIGWMSTEDMILKTTDGGETWIPDSWFGIGTHEIYEQFDFINDSVGWYNATMPKNHGIFKTIDGGKNWVKMQETPESEYGIALEYVSEEIVVVAGNSGFPMYKSTDGGDSWLDITPPAEHLLDPKSMSFTGPDTGIYAGVKWKTEGAKFNITYDGGKTWIQRTIPEYSSIQEIGFFDNLNGYFIAHRQYPYSDNVICKTEDAFETWTVVVENRYPIHSCHFFNKEVCIAIMEDRIGCKAIKSNDGGRTWNDSASYPLPGTFPYYPYPDYKFSSCKDSIVFICYGDHRPHYNNVLIKSTNYGETWSLLNLSWPLYDVCFLNDRSGFVVGGIGNETHSPVDTCFAGSIGYILETTNGGQSWNFIKGRHTGLRSCDFFNDSVGFAEAYCTQNTFCTNWEREAYYPTSLYKTGDGGERWNAYSLDFNNYTNATFISENIGFAEHDSSVYMTKNGGLSWDVLLHEVLTDSIGDFDATSIVSSNENTFWTIVGDKYNDNTRILRYTSDGDWEIIELGSGQELHLFEIFFRDENVGWITAEMFNGEYWETPLFKTEDGGESWNKINTPFLFSDMYFKDMQNGWAVGGDNMCHGVILETTNGGKDWIVQMDSLNGWMYGISYKDGYVWAVGQNGLILRMKDTSYVSAIEQQHASNEGVRQFNIYPNPTNSVLNIETDIPGQFSIGLLDLDGRILMNTISSGSRHQMDLSSFHTGIYLIVIRSDESVLTKKIHKY